MKKTLILCLLSAVFGGILAVLLVDPPSMTRRTAAQELGVPPVVGQPALPLAQPLPAEAPGGAAPYVDDFTPEERVNIAVYEHVNRSVVNITTPQASATRASSSATWPPRARGAAW